MRKLLKNSLLLLVFILGIQGCSLEEEYVEKTVQSQNAGRYKIEQKTFDDMVFDKRMSTIVKNYPRKTEIKNRLLSKTITSDDNGFYIDTEKSVYVEDTETAYESYTFLVMRSNTEDENVLENLVISFYEEGYYKIDLIQYQLTPEEKESILNDIDVNLSDNPKTVINIEDENFNIDGLNKVIVQQVGYCISIIEITCTSGEHNDSTGYSGCKCIQETTLYRDCNYGGGGGSLPGDDAIGGEPYYGDGGGGNPTPSNPNDPTGPGTGCKNCGGVVTSPLPEIEEVVKEKTPCSELQKIINTSSTKNAIIHLEGKTNDTSEWGWAVKTFSNSENFAPPTVVLNDPENSNRILLEDYVGGDYVGAFHTHPPTSTGTVPMFSAPDVRFLFQVADAHNKTPKTMATYFLTLTCVYGTYAIKIKNPMQFRNFILNKYSDFVNELEKQYEDMNGQTASEHDLEKTFLSLLKKYDAGVGLYELNNDKTQWNELTLNDNPTHSTDYVTETPCN